MNAPRDNIALYRHLDSTLGKWWMGIGYYAPGRGAVVAIYIRGSHGFPVHVASFI